MTKIKAVILVVLAVFGILVAAPIVLGNRVVEPFSELGILGPKMKLGDYPREVALGEEFNLYLYLGNYMGELSYYRIYAKLGGSSLNVSDSEPYGGVILDKFQYMLVDEANVTIPISMSLFELGLNQRLVFEMQRYEEDEGFVYDGQWVQLWLNVTVPG